MLLDRGGGILLHISSLPGAFGIGSLGLEARQFVDFLVRAEQKVWQILPLNSTGEEYSPYKSLSAFAGNPLLISLEMLVSEKWLTADEINDQIPSSHRVNYSEVKRHKLPLLKRAYERFRVNASELDRLRFQRFCDDVAPWLEDYVLFVVLKEYHGSASWTAWPEKERRRDARTMERLRQQFKEQLNYHRFLQYIFFRQWFELKSYANLNQVSIFGDMPIFVAFESADTWANPELFQLDEAGSPNVVAGVPPDYFSKTGQLWGNPLYNWEQLRNTGFQWWMDRLDWNARLFDLMRVDHFRGFEAYWSVPAGADTAIDGQWVKAPGEALFETIRARLGPLPIVAEDLGEITEEVERLRDKFELPGMRVLQFAFNGKRRNVHLPHNYPINCVAYTGTHDNDTIIGWFQHASKVEQKRARTYLNTTEKRINWDFIRTIWSSSASLAITTAQDVLGYGSRMRMNTPGTQEGNWTWKLKNFDKLVPLAKKLAAFSKKYER